MSDGFIFVDVDRAAAEHRSFLERQIATARLLPDADQRVMDLNARALAVSEAVLRFVCEAQNREVPWDHVVAVLPSALLNGMSLGRPEAMEIIHQMHAIIAGKPDARRVDGQLTFSDFAMQRGGRA